jgi:LysM repeat protein
MNSQNPFVPQGSFLDQKNKSRARVKLVVFVVLAINGIGLLGLLMAGCKPSAQESVPPPETSSPTNFEATATASVDTNGSNNAAGTVPVTAETNNNVVVPPTVTPVAASEYAVVKGDIPATIAKKFGITTKALMDANPGLQPTKLQIGQKLQIPAATASGAGAAPAVTPSVAAMDSTGAAQIYTVKSGDNLTKVAAQFHVSLKQLRAANNLKTDMLKVGQKLTIPAKTAPAAPVAPADTTTAVPAGR